MDDRLGRPSVVGRVRPDDEEAQASLVRYAADCFRLSAEQEGRLVSNKGLDIAVRDYEEHFAEEHVEHSNALHCRLKERGAYFVGPQARYNLNFDRLSPNIGTS